MGILDFFRDELGVVEVGDRRDLSLEVGVEVRNMKFERYFRYHY